MKQLFFAFILSGCLATSACKKCHTCTTYSTVSMSGQSSQSGTDQTELCDLSAAEIAQYEKDNTGSYSGTTGGISVSTSTVTNCN